MHIFYNTGNFERWKLVFAPQYLQGIMGQLSRAPPVVPSTYSCREHPQLSRVPTITESTYGCLDYLQLARTPSAVQSIYNY